MSGGFPDYRRSTGFWSKLGEHPERGEVHDRIRVGGQNVSGIVLIEGPVGMQRASDTTGIADVRTRK